MNDNDITTGEQIDGYLKKKFTPKTYRGIIIDLNTENIDDFIKDDPLRNNQFYINNYMRHWTAIYKKKNKYYEFDSYNRDMLEDDVIDKKISNKDIQGKGGIDDGDCGQRTIAFLLNEF